MKIIYVTAESYIDHSYTIIKELRKHLELSVFFSARKVTEEVKDFVSKTGAVLLIRKRFRNPLQVFSELEFINRLRKSDANLIWFNTLNIYQIILVKILLRNYIITLHDAELHPQSRDKHGKLSVWLTIFLHARRICTASISQAQVFKDKIGINPPVFRLPVIDYYKDTDVMPVRSSNGILRLFFFGSVERYKGIEILLDAAEMLKDRSDEFTLNIYGKIKYDEDKLINRINSIENVNLFNEFIDYRKVKEIYLDNDVIVLPYRQVTQCGPMLIAYSFGVPVIVSELPGFTEYVKHNLSGLFFSNTFQDLADKMKTLLDNRELIMKMRNYILNEIHSEFSMEKLASSYIRNFREVI